MSVSANELRQTIENLFPNIDDISDESLKRAYTNRCYYVTYHELRLFLETKFHYDLSDEGRFGNMGSHVRIYEALNDLLSRNKSNIQLKSLALKFRDFLTKRHKADYKLSENFDEYDFKQVVGYYEKIPDLLTQISP